MRQETGAAFATVRRLQRDVLLGGVALAVFFSLLGWLAARAVTRPLLSLADTARQIERGGSAQVQPSNAYSEVRVLGAALDSLLAQCGRQNEELQQLNAVWNSGWSSGRRSCARPSTGCGPRARIHPHQRGAGPFIGMAWKPHHGLEHAGRSGVRWAREEVLAARPPTAGAPASSQPRARAGPVARTGTSAILNRRSNASCGRHGASCRGNAHRPGRHRQRELLHRLPARHLAAQGGERMKDESSPRVARAAHAADRHNCSLDLLNGGGRRPAAEAASCCHLAPEHGRLIP